MATLRRLLSDIGSIILALALGVIVWTVAVNDESAAESQLLRLLLADQALAVTEFGRKQHQLEDVFVQIVEGGQDVKR